MVGGSQFVITTHSPNIMAYPEATIFLLDKSDMREVAYEGTEHFRVMRDSSITVRRRCVS